ncbi:MAG TPA: penicillin-binding transpeptidase domain-containing protein [Oscillospiraceae bacterium]|nr:penicillin-binding transpeptidase domain-containing protein [Oscillospiraceae bacterium]
MESNRKIVHVIVLMSVLFLSIIIYLTYIQIFRAEKIAQNPYNKRQWAIEDRIIRGSIYDRNGTVLAETKTPGDSAAERFYNYDSLYSHIIGYSSRQYGKAGIESYYNSELLSLTGDNTVAKIRETVTGQPLKGHSLTLTLDHNLQKKAEQLLRGKMGSIVAMNPRTGEILAMVSKPDYNPNNLAGDWERLVEDENSPLLNRSLSGLYPPGSIYKLVITASILENPDIDTDYNCTGTITIDGYTLADANKRGHGFLDLRRSVIVSCNTNFARMSVELGGENVTNISKKFLMGKKLDGDIPIAESRYPYGNNMKPTDLAAVAIGQGKLLVTPIHMAAMVSTFANKGVMMNPYIVEKVKNADGIVVSLAENKSTQIISDFIADQIKDMMVAAVREGTGKNARIYGVDVAGKTGTAQNETGESHSWFIGFAPAKNPQVAVAVILESEGRSGGEAAAPIAGEIMNEALRSVDR